MFNKRYQVLLSDWMDEYFQTIAKRYDLNMSSALRGYLCLGMIYVVSTLDPNFKTDLNSKDQIEAMKKISKGPLSGEEMYQSMSKILFEARKAAEHRFTKEFTQKS